MSLKPRKIDFSITWSKLKNTIEDVITLGSVERNEWNSRFVDIYTICVAHPEPLADKLYAVTKSFLEDHVKKLLKTKILPSDSNSTQCFVQELLPRYHQVWLEYSKGVEYLNFLYLYLNQQHIKKQKLSDVEVVYGCIMHDVHEQLEIGELGLDIWRLHMIKNISETLVSQLLEGIREDRRYENQSSVMETTMKGVIHSFVCVEEYKKKEALQLYQTIFEEPLLKDCGEFFKLEAHRLLQHCTVSTYMEEIIKKMEEENRRARKYLHSSSIDKIRRECEQRMIKDHLDFLYSECDRMVSTEKHNDLKNMYTILKPIPDGLKLFVQIFLEHIKTEGMQMISSLKGDLLNNR